MGALPPIVGWSPLVVHTVELVCPRIQGAGYCVHGISVSTDKTYANGQGIGLDWFMLCKCAKFCDSLNGLSVEYVHAIAGPKGSWLYQDKRMTLWYVCAGAWGGN